MAKVKHDHAVVVYTARLVGTTAAIVMEYIPGESLDHVVVRGKPMPLEWVRRVVTQICGCLDVAHELGIVHRDLKPSNIMRVAGRPAGEVHLKVLDFGLAKMLNPENNDAITVAKGAMGTAAYLSPEQAQGKDVDIRSDIYSLGVILYEFLTGYRPFDGSSFELINHHARTAPPPFHKRNPACRVPAAVERLVMRCLEKNPARRPRSARELAAAFEKAAPPPPQPQPIPVPPVVNSRSWIWPTALIGSFALLAFIGILTRNPGFLSLFIKPSVGIYLQYDAPVDGLDVKLDGSSVTGTGPFPVTAGRHEVVVTQGTVEAGKNDFDVTADRRTPVRIGITRRAKVRVDPPSASVSVDGAVQLPGKDEPLTLVFTGARPVDVEAKADGYAPFSRRLSYEEAAKAGFQIRLLPDQRLAEQGRSFLQQYCHRCHGVEFKAPGLDVLDLATLITPRGNGVPYLVPGKPAESAIWRQIEQGKMPPKTEKQPASDRKDAFKSWIVAGARAPIVSRRPFLSEKNAVTAVRDNLANQPDGDQRFQRFFSLRHVYNNQSVRDDELPIYRAALSKAINSVSRQPDTVIPQPIDAERTVYRVDMRTVASGWDNLWTELVQRYPYGLRHDRGTDTDRSLRSISREIYDITGTMVPVLRADWFVARATRPPLYHTLLGLPENAHDLEKEWLGVNVEEDFIKDRQVVRAGLVKSAVSSQHRIVERHTVSKGGYYWKSYDFRNAGPETDVLRFPLGPVFEGNRFAEHAFKHDVRRDHLWPAQRDAGLHVG